MGSLGEWGLLNRLLPRLVRTKSKRVVLGPGDDAALVRLGHDVQVLTTDMLVEGVHFRTAWGTGEDLGHKTLAVNLSDLAAMGDVEPTVGVLSAGIPPETPVSYIEGFFKGLTGLAGRHGFELVGGDTVRASRLTFSLTALGRVRGPVFKRSGARVGDALMVTGTLGDAAAGLAVRLKGRARGAGTSFLLKRFHRPEPRLAWARQLAKTGGVTACLDSSDGFWRSVTLLGGASGVGAEVWADRLPLSSALKKWAGDRAEEMALVGGEDYELVFTARPDCVGRISALGFAHVVGTVVSSRRGLSAFHQGRPREVPPVFEHFNG
jgi:thiamine-monophosphate kinase